MSFATHVVSNSNYHTPQSMRICTFMIFYEFSMKYMTLILLDGFVVCVVLVVMLVLVVNLLFSKFSMLISAEV